MADLQAVLTRPERITTTYQPILDVRNARTAGWELFSRFDDGRIPPDRWFEAAARAGLGADLERASLTRSLRALHLRAVPGLFLCVNVSPAALACPAVVDLLLSHAPLHGLVIDVSERPVPTDLDAWAPAVERLRAQGAMIAIDDVGSGYAEVHRMLGVRPNMLKVGREVVAGLRQGGSEHSVALFRELGELADELDAWILAAGVERPDQLAVLRALGVPLAQGWLIGRPSTVPERCADHVMGPAPWPPPEMVATACDADRDPAGPLRVVDVMRPARVVRDRAAPRRTARHGPPARPPAAGGTTDGRPAEWEVETDAVGVPTRVRALAPQAAGAVPVTLKVTPDLPVDAAARRALNRPAAARFDPLVCINAVGEVLGVVNPGDLLLTLAGGGSPLPPPGDRTDPHRPGQGEPGQGQTE